MAFPRSLFSLLLIALLIPHSAFAILKASFSDKPIDPSKETHIFVVGKGKEMGTLFFENAISTARRLEESFPERQFYFLIQPERGQAKDKAIAKQFRLNIISYDSRPLLGSTVVKEIQDFRKMASLEFFSHGHAVYGSALAGNEYNQRFYHGTPGIEKLKGAFTKNGYIMIHGCNAGFVSAPKLSRLLRVPVGGHLTGSNFQEPFTNRQWYFNDKEYYPAKSVATFAPTNTMSFLSEKSCSTGHCARLVADPHTYNGSFGRHLVGLGFRKFYCAYNYGNECYAAMATALLGFPSLKPITLSSSQADFKLVVKDLLCPSDVSGEKRKDCFAALDRAMKTGEKDLSYFRGGEPVCELDGCKVTAKCKERNCVISADDDKTSKENLINEYKLYMRGYNYVFNAPRVAPAKVQKLKIKKAEGSEEVESSSLNSALSLFSAEDSQKEVLPATAAVSPVEAGSETKEAKSTSTPAVEGMLMGLSMQGKKVMTHFPRGRPSAN